MRFIRVVLSAVLVVGLMPSSAFAEKSDPTQQPEVQVQPALDDTQDETLPDSNQTSPGAQDFPEGQENAGDVSNPDGEIVPGEDAPDPGANSNPAGDDPTVDNPADDNSVGNNPSQTQKDGDTSAKDKKADKVKTDEAEDAEKADKADETEDDGDIEIDPLADEGMALFDAGGRVSRLQGADALGTMTAITRQGFANKSCEAVVVATMDGYWDALTASSLAGIYNCPVLLTNGSKLSSQTISEIKRLGASKAYIAGGTAAISESVEISLAKLVKTVKRLQGPIAIDTALSLYKEGKASWGTTAVVATSASYHDALSVSPYAYAKHAPIFLANAQTHKLDDRVMSAIKAHGFTRVLIVGGPAALSTDIENKQLASIPCVRRSGDTAYETSSAIAQWCVDTGGMSAAYAGVATGDGYWDALSGAALCAKNNSVLVLASDGNRSPITSFIRQKRNDVQCAFVFGGTAAVTTATYDVLVGALLNPEPATGTRVFEPGTYRIALSANNTMTLDVAGGSTSDRANIQVYTANATAAQSFEFVWDAKTKCYTILNVKSFKALDLTSLNPLTGTNVLQRTSNGADSQKWAALDGGAGTVALINRATGKALYAKSVSNAANVVTTENTSSAAQKFKLIAADLIKEGFYAVRARVANDRFLDVPYSSRDEGKQLQVYSSNGNIAQKFVFKKVATNTYEIRSLVSGKLLGESGTKVVQTSKKGASSQWRSVYRNGGICFINKASGRAMAISGGSTALNASLVSATADGSLSQRFLLSITDPLPSGGNYTLAPACDSSKRLNLANASWKVRTNVNSYASNGSNAQKWEIISLGNGQYRITSSLTWRDVEVANGSTSNGANVRVYSRNSGAAQRWRAQVTSDGWYTFVNVGSGKALGVSGNSISSGANVASLISNGASGQKWRLVPTSAASISGNSELDGYLRGTIHSLGSSPTLRKAFDWTCNRKHINDAGPRYWGIMSNSQTIDRALYMYRNGYGDCYNYAATFMWLARALGYSANARAGAVPGYSGQAAHGWTEIYNGGTYVCDPNLTFDYPTRDWYMITYSNAPTEYIL